jgi:hypothetical protein
MIFILTFANHCTVHVARDVLFPVDASMLVVFIFAVLTNTYHELSKFENVHVRVIVPPLPAGSVPIAKFVVGNVICPLIVSMMLTLDACLPQLFP